MSNIVLAYREANPLLLLDRFFFSYVQRNSEQAMLQLNGAGEPQEFTVTLYEVETPMRGTPRELFSALQSEGGGILLWNSSSDLGYLWDGIADSLTEGVVTLDLDAKLAPPSVTFESLRAIVDRYFGGASIVNIGFYTDVPSSNVHVKLLVHATIIKNAAEMVRELNNLGVQKVTFTENIRPLDDEAVGVGPVEAETSDVIVGLTDEDGVVYTKSETAPAQAAVSDAVVNKASGATSLAAFGVALFLLIWWNNEDK